MIVNLPFPPFRLSPNARIHWGEKSRISRDYKTDCFYACKSARLKVSGSPHLEIKFLPPDKRRRDMDNMIASFKAGQDGVAMALDIDDSNFTTHYSVGAPVPGGAVIVSISPPAIARAAA